MSQIANHWSDSESVNIARGGSAASQPVYVDEYGADAVLYYGVRSVLGKASLGSRPESVGCSRLWKETYGFGEVMIAHIGW